MTVMATYPAQIMSAGDIESSAAWEHSDSEARSICPSTSRLMDRFEDHSLERVDYILEKAVGAQITWRKATVGERSQRLVAVAQALDASRQELADNITAEMGKPIAEALAEIDKCAMHCRWYAAHAERLLRDQPTEVDGGRAYVAQRPIGLVLGIMPWNFPLWQAMRAAIPIMISGNGFVLKHARNVMRSAFGLEAIFRESGLPDGIFSVLNINQDTTMRVLGDPRIAAVTLTGSASAGAAVASRAGGLLKKSLLELGGSDPFIVLGSADVQRAALAGIRARFQNAGQVCIAAKRFIIAASIADEFAHYFVEGAKSLRVGDPFDLATDVGPMARPDLRAELHEQILTSVAAGARLLCGGRPVEGQGNFYLPTVLADVRPGMRVFDEETFGPCAALTTAVSTEEAVRLANLSAYGLSASLWTSDQAEAERIASRLECGGVFINGYSTSDPRVPIGGVKRSGFGRELSQFGVTEFTNVQTVWCDRT